MDIILKIVGIFLSLGMLGVAYMVRRFSGSWQAPASLYAVAWFLFTFIPLIALPGVPVNPLAVGYILLTCVAFALPVLGTAWREIPFASEPLGESEFDRPFLRYVFYLFAGLTIVSLVLSTLAQGVSLSSLMSNFFQVSNSLIADRYNQSTTTTIFSQVSNVASYVTVGLAGLVYPGYRSGWARLRILTIAMAPSLIVMTVFGAKGMIFLCIAMFYAGTLVRRSRDGDYRLMDRGTVTKAMIAAAILLPFVAISFIARGLYEAGGAGAMADGLYRYFVSYSCAHLYAFSDWFSWYVGMDAAQIYAKDGPTGGFYTFMSLFQLAGSDKQVPPGVYDEYFQYSWYLQTNIYTMFRGLILDYTLIGSLVFSSVLGFVSNQCYVAMVRSKTATWSIAFYLVFAGFIYTSFIISLLIWNSMYPVFVILGAVLLKNRDGAAAERRRQTSANLVTRMQAAA